MLKDIGSDPERACCEACRAEVPSYDIVNYGSIEDGYRELCTKCFNVGCGEQDRSRGIRKCSFRSDRDDRCCREGARVPFPHASARIDGFPGGIRAEARRAWGYQFQILGDPEDDLLSLLGRLVERMRRRLAVRHIESSEHGTQIVDKTVRAQIDWDETMDGRVPLLIIDGQEVSWDEFGRMLMTFEGWQFRLEVGDRSEEL